MIAQILRDDAILQHPSEGDAVAAGRPRQLSRTTRNSPTAACAAPATMVRLPCVNPETAIRPRRNGRAIQPTQHSPSSTASVALWVAAAKAVKPNSRHFSEDRGPLAMRDQDEERQHGQAGKNVGQQHAGKPGQRGGQDQHEADRQQPQRLRHAEHAQRQLQDPQRRQRLDPEIDPEIRILAEMKIEAEHGGAAGHQIAFVPPRQIAAGIPLEQRIAIPQGGGQQHQWDGDGGDPGRPRIRSGPRAQYLRADVTSPHLRPACRGMAGRPKFTNSRTLAGLIS